MKKHILFAALAAFSSGLYACKFTVANNTSQVTIAYSIVDNELITIPVNHTLQVGKNPDIHADFIITIQKNRQPKTFHVKQIACSKAHAIHLTTSQITDQKTDIGDTKGLLTIKEVKSF